MPPIRTSIRPGTVIVGAGASSFAGTPREAIEFARALMEAARNAIENQRVQEQKSHVRPCDPL